MAKDMTKGSLLSPLIRYTLPLIAGNFLQLTYNAIDSMVVGRYVGKEALAAVGTSNPIMTLILLFTNGICLGAGLLVSYHFGAKEEETLKKQVSTGMCAGMLFSLITGGVVALLAPSLMRLLQVDRQVLSYSAGYLRLIMAGLVFSFTYNYMASMLRAIGDSASPLIFLGVSSVLNIAGDLVLVAGMGLGIMGAALSTILCEALSAVLCWVYVYRKIPQLRLGRRWLHIDAGLLKKTLSFGIVSALQQSSVQFGKLVIQGFVNTLGVTSTAAFNAVNRTDDYAVVPEQNIAHAMSAVMAQNAGAHHEDRVKKTFRYGMGMEMVFGITISVLLYGLAGPIMRLFTTDAGVIGEGVSYLKLIAFMYPLPALTNGLQGYFRGIGDLKVTLISSVLNMSVRCLVCWGMMAAGHFAFRMLPWSYLAGWAAMCLFEIPWLIHTIHKRRKEGKEEERWETV